MTLTSVTSNRLRVGINSMPPLWTVSLFVHLDNINHSDLLDTVRAEALHVVQGNMVDHCVTIAYYEKFTPEHIKDQVFNDYPEHLPPHQTRAFILLEFLSEQDIIKSIDKYCFE